MSKYPQCNAYIIFILCSMFGVPNLTKGKMYALLCTKL